MSPHLLRVASITLLTLFVASGWAGAAKKKEKVPGTLWTYTIANGDKKESGTFRILDMTIYKDDKKIGKATQTSEGETTLTFAGFPELNGTAKVIKQKLGVCTGTLKKSDGTQWEFKAHVSGD